MPTLQVSAQREIQQPADVIYTLLADYANHHQHVLPPAFTNYRVEAGGYGAGTVLSVTSTLGGRSRQLRFDIDEPEPGRLLREKDQHSDMTTTFTVEPVQPGSCRVTIESTWTPARGIAGWIEQRAAPGMLRKLYDDELSRLGLYAVTRPA